jgi:hypothetical protein
MRRAEANYGMGMIRYRGVDGKGLKNHRISDNLFLGVNAV